ncbi:MAG: helix-turn-helix domain-containing protein, partial [Acidobacteriota bacterium]|nr:helix-turn-helix domain-containing protein [Acidobacteriota bacterium]
EDTKEVDERGCEITDPELAEFKGCSERTIQRWRKQYLKEEKYLKVPFLQITEGDFDKGLNANRPTRYRFLIDTEVADAVLEARNAALYADDRLKALKLSSLRIYDSMAKPVGTRAIRRRRKKELT